MTVSDHMVRCSFGGHIQSSQSWSSSLWIRTPISVDFITQADLHALVLLVGPILDTLASSCATTAWATGTQYDTNHFSYYPANAARATLVESRSPSTVAGSGSAMVPAFTAIVASLRSAHPGRGGRGRSYYPFTSSTPFSGGSNQISSAACGVMSAAYRTAINAINALTPPTHFSSLTCAIRSSSTGNAQPITSVIVDSKPDAQHRREDKLLPLFTSVASIP